MNDLCIGDLVQHIPTGYLGLILNYLKTGSVFILIRGHIRNLDADLLKKI